MSVSGKKEKRKTNMPMMVTESKSENNLVTITGKVLTGFQYSHQLFGERFYRIELLVKRLSDAEDRIPVMVSDRLINVNGDYIGEYITVEGQFRSYNLHDGVKSHLMLSVFAREIRFVEEAEESLLRNDIFLDGYLCKAPVFRRTPLGREIADILLAVNRPYGKSDYIPCVCWGRTARYASAFAIGGHILIWGRIQSRLYSKKKNARQVVRKTAYEVSAAKLEYLE